MHRSYETMPRARTEDVIVHELPDETLVYDEAGHQAHCLNRTATLVWKRCDGRMSLAEAATEVGRDLGRPVAPAVITMALTQLARGHLLVDPPSGATSGPMSRRDVIRLSGWAGALSMLLPVVHGIVAPTAASAQSTTTSADCAQCIGVGLPCDDAPGDCIEDEGWCECSSDESDDEDDMDDMDDMDD